MATGDGKVVCVTGGSGYIAAWLTKLLLERGYIVRATVRNLGDTKKTEHLLALDGAKERLSLFEADLTKDGSFDPAIEGCDGVFHTASPCFYECKDPQAELIDPAVKGTINVLNSCARSSSVKRVVVTSSTATMMLDPSRRLPGAVADETWFSDPEFCKDLKLWYIVSKILAEEAALKFADEKGIDVVVMHPGMVIGPLLQPTLNFSTALIATLINDVSSYPNMVIGWIHVKDVALAHILAFEIPSANGRYPLIESTLHLSRVLGMMRELYPTLQLPEKYVEGIFPDMIPTTTEKMKSLGVDCCIPLQVGLKETIESLKERKFISI